MGLGIYYAHSVAACIGKRLTSPMPPRPSSLSISYPGTVGKGEIVLLGAVRSSPLSVPATVSNTRYTARRGLDLARNLVLPLRAFAAQFLGGNDLALLAQLIPPQ
jgi:hypothetical protein